MGKKTSDEVGWIAALAFIFVIGIFLVIIVKFCDLNVI